MAALSLPKTATGLGYGLASRMCWSALVSVCVLLGWVVVTQGAFIFTGMWTEYCLCCWCGSAGGLQQS